MLKYLDNGADFLPVLVTTTPRHEVIGVMLPDNIEPDRICIDRQSAVTLRHHF